LRNLAWEKLVQAKQTHGQVVACGIKLVIHGQKVCSSDNPGTVLNLSGARPFQSLILPAYLGVNGECMKLKSVLQAGEDQGLVSGGSYVLDVCVVHYECYEG